jgi:hypothetical protein
MHGMQFESYPKDILGFPLSPEIDQVPSLEVRSSPWSLLSSLSALTESTLLSAHSDLCLPPHVILGDQPPFQGLITSTPVSRVLPAPPGSLTNKSEKRLV